MSSYQDDMSKLIKDIEKQRHEIIIQIGEEIQNNLKRGYPCDELINSYKVLLETETKTF
jgi:hypothetical protein